MASRWSIERNNPVLVWDCNKHPEDHTDFIEMSGLYSSAVITYGIKEGKLFLHRHLVFPMLRIFPNNTHGSLQCDVPEELVPVIRADGKPVREDVECVELCDGTITVYGRYESFMVIRRLYPSPDHAAFCETVTLVNDGNAAMKVETFDKSPTEIYRVRGPHGINIVERSMAWEAPENGVVEADGYAVLSVCYTARLAHEPTHTVDVGEEWQARANRVNVLTTPLTLTTENPTLDTMFRFAKLRAGESIFRTWNGDVHSPGGTSYYAAVWCNDQAEYAGPWQAWTGDELQLNAAYNAYAWYYPHMDDRYEPIPSSIIAEGLDIWNGAGDRGDAAMYLFGASRYALVSRRLGENNALWNAIQWCAEYNIRMMDNEIHKGLIPSDRDELEGRLPAGKINLSTNMLALGGFRTAAALADELGEPALAERYREAAKTIDAETESYFTAEIRGFDTYKYYAENTTLRSWICLPLCMDVAPHAKGTAAAITSPYLYSEAGQLSEEGPNVAWDRSTLYGLRGMYRAAVILSENDPAEGKDLRKIATDYLVDYCEKRLIGDHVPYAIEAYPEGGKRHLSAESALFCQIITEGILAVQPLSFTSFSFNTVIPEGLPRFILTNIHAFGETFDLAIEDGKWTLTTESGKTFSGLCEGRVTVEFGR
ncbi:MAG: hypothetical protein IJW00_05990 [Clostridia bacterium]|nr:hypothetical protein [Clostridia bacterium]